MLAIPWGLFTVFLSFCTARAHRIVFVSGLDRSGEYFTDLHGDDGDFPSEDDVCEDVWSGEEADSGDDGREDDGRTPSPRAEDRSSAAEEIEDEDRPAGEEDDSAGEWSGGDEEPDGELPDEEEDHKRGGLGARESDSEEDREDAPHGEDSGDDGGRAEYESGRYRAESPHAGADGEDTDSHSASEGERGDQEPDWYPMEDSRAADLRLELPRSSPGVSAPPDGRRRRPRAAGVTFSGRPPEAAPSQRRAAARSTRVTSATAWSRGKTTSPLAGGIGDVCPVYAYPNRQSRI